MTPHSLLGLRSSTDGDDSPARRRINAGFDAFIRRMEQERRCSLGWTPQLFAERVKLFSLHCRELEKAANLPEIFGGNGKTPPTEPAPDGAPQWQVGRPVDLEALNPELPEGYLKLARRLMRLLDQPGLLAIGGDRGTGKTALATGLAQKFCQCGRSALFQTVAGYFHRLSGTPWEEKDHWRLKHQRVDLLILDEVQVRDSDRQWQDNELTELINARHQSGLATVLVSNLKPDALKANLGDSIWRRLIETGGQPIETKWPRLADHFARLKLGAQRQA